MSGNSGSRSSADMSAEEYRRLMAVLRRAATPDADDDTPDSPHETPRPTRARSADDQEGTPHVEDI